MYLITYVDDYGRGSADPELIKGFVFPRRKRVAEADIANALAELAGMGCISLYDVDGESYFYFPNWGEHQRIQNKHSKYPAPEESDSSQASTEIHGGSPSSTVDYGESRPESESESEAKSESESEAEAETRVRARENGGGNVERYLSDNLLPMSPGNYEALRELMQQGMTGDMVCMAVDIATAKGARTWAFVQSVLNAWVVAGLKNVGEVKDYEAKRKAGMKRGAGGRDAEHRTDHGSSQSPHIDDAELERFEREYCGDK